MVTPLASSAAPGQGRRLDRVSIVVPQSGSFLPDSGQRPCLGGNVENERYPAAGARLLSATARTRVVESGRSRKDSP